MRDKDEESKDKKRVDESRRDFLKGSGLVAGGLNDKFASCIEQS